MEGEKSDVKVRNEEAGEIQMGCREEHHPGTIIGTAYTSCTRGIMTGGCEVCFQTSREWVLETFSCPDPEFSYERRPLIRAAG